jgi:myo-inositol catabolism protein IolS
MLSDIKIGLGTGGLGGYFTPDLSSTDTVSQVLKQALDLGVSFFDTASNYAGGYAEQLLGKAIRGRRHEVIIATKFGVECRNGRDVRLALNTSLTRLGTDYVDLYQNHWPNPEADFEDILNELRLLADEGKIRRVGLCNLPLNDIKSASDVLLDLLATIQDEYNLLERGAESTIQPFCRETNLSFLAYSPLLGGRSLQAHPSFPRFQELAQDLDLTVHTLSLLWLVSKPNVIPIPRTSSLNHLRKNLSCIEQSLEEEVVNEIDTLFRPLVVKVLPSNIVVVDAHDRAVYKTLEEALKNDFNLVPSPIQMSERFLAGELPKPLKLRRLSEGSYALVEGRLKYWGWVIAFGQHGKPIDAIIED